VSGWVNRRPDGQNGTSPFAHGTVGQAAAAHRPGIANSANAKIFAFFSTLEAGEIQSIPCCWPDPAVAPIPAQSGWSSNAALLCRFFPRRLRNV
jgi:hypothetical protein